MLTTSKILDSQYTIKKYNEDSYKLILYKTNQYPGGYEKKKSNQIKVDRNVNQEKLENNISRTRTKIWEYAECNDFTYFITLTLDKEKKDRQDLDEYIKTLGQYIRNNRRLTGSDIQYLLIPEQHKKDNAWHMHGLINGVNDEDLELFTLDQKLPDRLRELLKQGRKIYNWIPYNKKFGYVTVEKINNKSHISKYITKYIKKDIGISVKEKNKKSYYVSRKLKQGVSIKKGTFPTQLRNALRFKYENDYVALIDLNKEQYIKLTNLL